MIVDTSAIIAILTGEPERDDFVRLIEAAPNVRMSAATYLETMIVADRARDPVVSRRVDGLFETLSVDIVDVTAEHARIARNAYRDFGRGSGSPAHLNFGDCFAYALAQQTREPLLFKGDDFVHTDVRPATPP